MIWKVLALFGAGSFFVVGGQVWADPNCNSVSFRGGGARTVITSCFTNNTGDFSKSMAVTSSFLIGLTILAIIFWPIVKAFMGNLDFSDIFSRRMNQGEIKKSIEETLLTNEITEQQGIPLRKSMVTSRRSKVIASILSIVLILSFYKVFAPKIDFLNAITCSGLKKELRAMDVNGREIWNEYQSEVSRLGQIDVYDNNQLWLNQVANVSRRASQLLNNDLAGYELMLQNGHCVNIDSVKSAQSSARRNLNFIAGKVMQDNGKFWSPEWGWSSTYYSQYYDFSEGLK